MISVSTKSILWVAFALLSFSSPVLWAESKECAPLLEPNSAGGAPPSPEQVLHRLQQLEPYFLDYQNLQGSIEDLMSGLHQLKRPYQNLKTLEKAVKSGAVEPEAVFQMANAMAHKIAGDAAQKMSETGGHNHRKALEGERILLSRLQHLQRRALNEIQRRQEEGARAQSTEPSSADENAKEKSKQQAEKRPESKQPKRQMPEKRPPTSLDDLAKEMAKNLDEKLQRQAKPEDVEQQSKEEFSDLKDKSAESILEDEQKKAAESAQETKSDEAKPAENPPKSEAEKAIRERLEQQVEEALEKDAKQKAEKKADQEAKEKAEAAAAEAESKSQGAGEPGEKGDKPGQEGKSGQKGKPGDGKKPGQDGKSGASKDGKPGQPKDGKPGDQGDQKGGDNKDGQGERRKGQEGKADTKRADGSQKDGSDGQIEGGGHGAKDILDSFKDTFDKIQSERAKSEDFKKISEEDLEKQKRDRKFDSKLRSSEQKKERDTTKAKPENPIQPKQIELLLQELVKATWQGLLSQYQNSARLLRQLADFSAVCQSLAVTHPSLAHFLKPYAQRASDLAEKFNRLNVDYKDLEELGLSLSGGAAKPEVIRRIRFIEGVLSEKEKTQSMHEAEIKTLDLARAILAAAEKLNKAASNKEVVETLADTLLGPLSRRALDQGYPATHLREDMNYESAFEALKNGKLNDLVLYTRLAPFVNILLNDIYRPKYYDRHEGEFVPINEADVTLERADDFDDVPQIVREGNPAQLEIMRLLAGDLLKKAYREKVRKSDPRKPIPKRASIILYDISGSMSSQSKQTIRNAIVNAFVDRSQTDVATGGGEHTLYLVPFDAKPHAPRRVSSLAEAQQFFDDMRAHPLGSGGDDSITEGMVKAYEMIAEHQKNGGELERANILLITDAVASIHFDKVEQARAKVDPSVDLALNAVTVGDWNKDVSEMIKKYAINGNGEIGKVSHQHIPYEEINRLLNVKGSVADLMNVSKDFNKSVSLALPDRILDAIRGSVLGIANHNDTSDRTVLGRAEKWVKNIETTPSSPHDSLAQGLADDFLEISVGNVAKEWTLSAKMNLWEAFLSDVELKTGATVEQFLPLIDSKTRGLIAKWLAK